mgnify:CR=1 FL=1
MGVRVKISSNLICIWIISNLLFIPSLKSSELIPSQSQVICHINLSDHSSRDSIDEDTFNLGSYCEIVIFITIMNLVIFQLSH